MCEIRDAETLTDETEEELMMSEGKEPMEKHHKSHCITQVPIFNHLSREEMSEIASVMWSARYEKGEMIFFSGEAAKRLYILHEGMMKQVRVTASGREQIVRVLYPGDFLGELALFGNATLEGYAETLEPAVICHLRGDDLREKLVHFPAISVKILEKVSDRLGQAEQHIEQLGAHPVEERVAGILLQLAEHGKMKGDKVYFTLPFTKGDLASLIGTSQESLSRKLTTFQDQGLITMEGQRDITIMNLGSLRRVASGESSQ